LKARLEKPPVVGAMHITLEVRKYTAHCTQQAVVSFILVAMEDMVTEIGTGRRRNLRKHAIEAAKEYLSNGENAHKTAERWFMHYLQYGETYEETSKWLKMKLTGGIRRLWTVQDTAALKAIIDTRPGLFLDELVDRIEATTQARWNPSTVWNKLRKEVKYSLQRVAEKVLEQDLLERHLYDVALKAAVNDPAQLVYIDESQKGRNASRRLRWWSPRGRSPVRQTVFDYEPKKRYTLLRACDVNGFLPGACDIVLRGSGTQEEAANPTIGTTCGKMTDTVSTWSNTVAFIQAGFHFQAGAPFYTSHNWTTGTEWIGPYHVVWSHEDDPTRPTVDHYYSASFEVFLLVIGCSRTNEYVL
jgi:hypothetical protein